MNIYLYFKNFNLGYTDIFSVALFTKVDKKYSYTLCRVWQGHKQEYPHFQKEKKKECLFTYVII